MLKYKENENLTGDIDGVNKIFVSDNYIALVNTIKVDGVTLTEDDYVIDRYTITLNVAPITSIELNHFYREELDIKGEGTVEFGDIVKEIYDELGRNNISKVYRKERVEKMAEKSLIRITNKVVEKRRVQHYALGGLNGLKVTGLTENGFDTGNIQGVGIEGAMLSSKGVYIPYTDTSGGVFETVLGVNTILEEGEKIIVGHRIPYGVKKVVRLYVDGVEYSPIDNQEFNMYMDKVFTIITGKDGSEYIFLPYSEKSYVLSVKYTPDRERITRETDIVNIPYEYTSVIAYDVLYRILLSRDDTRAQSYKSLLYGDNQDPGMLKEYRAYIKELVKRFKGKINNQNSGRCGRY